MISQVVRFVLFFCSGLAENEPNGNIYEVTGPESDITVERLETNESHQL